VRACRRGPGNPGGAAELMTHEADVGSRFGSSARFPTAEVGATYVVKSEVMDVVSTVLTGEDVVPVAVEVITVLVKTELSVVVTVTVLAVSIVNDPGRT
jgi:hypothetical protein